MATKIVTKNSSTASAVPTASDLVQGELAVNVADKRLFTEDNAGAIVELGTNPSGNVTFQDNGKAIFGAGSDLQIYHDGSNNHTFVKESGSGNLYVQANNLRLQSVNGGNYAQGIEGDAFKLYFNDGQKLATTSTGIDVTGTATMDNATFNSSAASFVTFPYNGFNYIDTTGAGAALLFRVGSTPTNALRLSSNNDISFYEDTGTTPKLFWDASAESLGIGTSSTQAPLHVAGNILCDAFNNGGAGNGLFFRKDFLVTTQPSITLKDHNGSSADGLSINAFDGISFSLNDSEKMRIDSSGNVGIGTASPTFTLEVNGGGAADNLKVESQSTLTNFYQTTTGGTTVFQNNNGNMAMYTGGTERMSIDSSGNVKINAAGSLLIRDDGSFIKEAGGLQIGNTSGTGTTRPILFYTESAERMRINSLGDLLVGKSSGPNYNAVGADITHLGEGQFTVNNGEVLQLNRKSSDGTIVNFRKDGTAVGSIGASSGYTKITSGDGTNGSGLQFGDSKIYPVEANSVVTDNAVDFGDSNYRFKDLYLSGGVYLGGTGAANKLDDYEEGTWTPVIAGSGGGAYTYTASATARYTKIGNLVTLSAAITNIELSGSGHAGYVQIQGAPFNKDSSTFATGSIELSSGNMSNGQTFATVSFISASETNVMYIRQLGDNSAGADFPVGGINSSNTDFNFTITYQTA